MNARDVIEKAGADAFAAFLDEYRIRAQNPGAGPASTRDWLEEACGRYRETFLAALAAAGYGTFDTATHAAVPKGLAGWMPIETAPRDGQKVFVWWPHWYSTPIIASCLGDYETWLSEMVLAGDGPGPTHWFPLPDPPAAEAEAKETDDGE